MVKHMTATKIAAGEGMRVNDEPEFSPAITMNGRLYFDRHLLENYKRALLGLSPLPRDEQAPIKLVPSAQVTEEFGFGRRTLGRRIAGSRAALVEARTRKCTSTRRRASRSAVPISSILETFTCRLGASFPRSRLTTDTGVPSPAKLNGACCALPR